MTDKSGVSATLNWLKKPCRSWRVDILGEYPIRHGRLQPPLLTSKLNNFVFASLEVRVGKGVCADAGWAGTGVNTGVIDGGAKVGIDVNSISIGVEVLVPSICCLTIEQPDRKARNRAIINNFCLSIFSSIVGSISYALLLT